MRELTVNTFVTLDGVMQAPGGPEEDPSGGFQHGGWSVNYWDEGMGQEMDAYVQKPFDLLLGRKTYEIFAAHWPHIQSDPMADRLNAARKYVASRTLKHVDWANSELLEGDAAGAVRNLKEGSGPEIQVHGSANLLQTLIRNGLVDEFRVWTFPVTIGNGKRLFAEGTMPAGLKVLGTKAFSTGVVFTTYAPAGALQTGSFALEEPTPAEQKRRAEMAQQR